MEIKSYHFFYLIFFLFVSFQTISDAQDQTILIYDPYNISADFQYSFHQITNDSIYVAGNLDENIFNYDALFIFIGSPYVLTQTEGNLLTSYLQTSKPVYIYTSLFIQDILNVNFWKVVGIDNYAELATTVMVDSVLGIESEFTAGIVIDTGFVSLQIPAAQGNINPILKGKGSPMDIDVAYISGVDSLNIIIDQYNQIYHIGFLERVLVQFGLEEPVGVKDDSKPADRFKLFQNYPNPFNPGTNIKFTIGNRQYITLKVYDVLGNEVATLSDDVKEAGSYEVEFDAAGLPSGVYFYQLRAGNYSQTRKMILLR